MTNDGVNSQTYDAYDGNGLRVQKVAGSTTTVYVFSGSKVIAEYQNGAAPSSPTKEYIYSGGALLATVTSSGKTYHHQDHLSVRMSTDTNGNDIADQGHFPYGESWYMGSSGTKWQFTSYERDAESGNDYAQARSYVNRLGRFSSPDPIFGSISDPQSLNRYSYVRNMPVMAVDPTGLWPGCSAANHPDDGENKGVDASMLRFGPEPDSEAEPEPQGYPCLDGADMTDGGSNGPAGYGGGGGGSWGNSLTDILGLTQLPVYGWSYEPPFTSGTFDDDLTHHPGELTYGIVGYGLFLSPGLLDGGSGPGGGQAGGGGGAQGSTDQAKAKAFDDCINNAEEQNALNIVRTTSKYTPKLRGATNPLTTPGGGLQVTGAFLVAAALFPTPDAPLTLLERALLAGTGAVVYGIGTAANELAFQNAMSQNKKNFQQALEDCQKLLN